MRFAFLFVQKPAEELTKLAKIEYLVVNYKKADPNVTLSLRQADILTALAQDEKLCAEGGCVPDLQNVDV
jgi:glutamate--cysteine ligase catalytic subunit